MSEKSVKDRVRENTTHTIQTEEKQKYDEIVKMAFSRADKGRNFLYIGTGFWYESWNILNWAYCVTMSVYTNIEDIVKKLKEDGFEVKEDGNGKRYIVSWAK